MPLQICFSCFWNWPNSTRSQKISSQHVQTFLLETTDSAPDQLTRPLRDHVTILSLGVSKFIYLPSVTQSWRLSSQEKPEFVGRGLQHTPDAETWRFLAGRFQSNRSPKNIPPPILKKKKAAGPAHTNSIGNPPWYANFSQFKLVPPMPSY